MTTQTRNWPPAEAEGQSGEAASQVGHHAHLVTAAYPITDWTTLDEVTVEPNPALTDELAGEYCDWCGFVDCPARFRVHGPWMVAQDVCAYCVEDCAEHAANTGNVTVETAS